MSFFRFFVISIIIFGSNREILASDISILHPESLKTQLKNMESSLANFGDFDYGTTLIGRIHYPNLRDNANGCKELSSSDFATLGLKNEIDHNAQSKIIMLDRGTCHFVLKALHAQKFGAVMLLVVDDKKYESPD